MTLVVAVATADGVWLASERMAGDFDYVEIARPKVFELEGDGYHFGIGFSGSPRVAQTILAVTPPSQRDGSLHWWLTEYADRIYQRGAEFGGLCDPHNGDGAHTAGGTAALLAIEGKAILLAADLSWEERTCGYVATGGAYETWTGAFEVLRDQHDDPIEAARRAWPYAQRKHRIGDLVDEIFMPGA